MNVRSFTFILFVRRLIEVVPVLYELGLSVDEQVVHVFPFVGEVGHNGLVLPWLIFAYFLSD